MRVDNVQIARWLAIFMVVLFAQAVKADVHSDQGGAYSHCAEMAAITCPAVAGSANWSCSGPTGTSTLRYWVTRDGVQYNTYQTCIGPHDYTSTATCSARNSTLGASERVYIGSAPICVAGCQMQHGATISTTLSGVTHVSTEATQYTGATCSNSAPITQPSPTSPDASERCTPLPNNQTGCVQTNGQYCATSSTGARFCWTPGQTGEQQMNGDLQRRSSGNNRPTTEPLTPPPINNQWNVNNSHSIIHNGQTVTITNYSVTVVQDDGHTDSGGYTGDTGNDQDPPNSATGTGECGPGSAWTCSGDPIQCAQLLELHESRCAIDASQAGEYAPNECANADPGECGADEYTCATLFELRAIRCAQGETGGESTEIPTAAELAGVMDGQVGPDPTLADVTQTVQIDVNSLDDGGYLSGARTCPLLSLPSLEMFGNTIPISFDLLCDALSILAWATITGAYIGAAFILMRIGS